MASTQAVVTVIGNVGRDPEMKYSREGMAITEFSVAVSHSKPDGHGGWEDLGTNWFRCTLFGDRAERANKDIRKGDRITVWGPLNAREWTSDKTHKSGTSLEVRVDGYVRQTKREESEESEERPNAPAPTGDVDLDDLPF